MPCVIRSLPPLVTTHLTWNNTATRDPTMIASISNISSSPSKPQRAGWLARRLDRAKCLFVLGLLFSAVASQAQWLSQSFTLKPGWNAIYTHVDASYLSLDDLVPDANGPVAEIWLWKPTFSTIQFIDSPYTNAVANSQWGVWTSARGDTDTLTSLAGNGAYLVNNRSTSDFVWTVKGKPVPPNYQWTTTGLNFLGFPTPASAPPSFATYLTPAPSLDLSKTLQNFAHIFRYPGGNLGTTNPTEVVSLTASTTPVTRGQAFWVRGSTNYYNRYYGPVEVTPQSTTGIEYGDTLGTYSLRLKNLTTTSRTVTFNLLNSETPPANQQAVSSAPQLLVRGALNSTTLTYDFAVLTNQQFTLAAGAELQVVLGLNRSAMTAAAGSLYAAILRVTDTAGLEQVDVPVSATVPDSSGLWVGQANISQVGQYLKSYPKVDTSQTDQTALINAAAAQANRPPSGGEMPGSVFIAHETNTARAYSAVASSLDGKTLVAASSGGSLYVSQDFGSTWTTRDSNRSWAELTCSGDGSLMAATVFNGSIYVSTNYGTNWTSTGSGSAAWVGLACASDGNLLAAVAQNGSVYTSLDRGANWTARSGAGLRNWSSITASADGSHLAATVNPGQIYVSADSGNTWRPVAFSTNWVAIASSADGTNLVAAVNNGLIYTSADAGSSWTGHASAARWSSVASSTDGRRLTAAVANGQLYTSEDAGSSWTARDQSRNWDDIVASADATRLAAVVNGGAIYTLNRTFASYTVDQTTGLVQDQNGVYLSSGVNTNLAKVGNVFPLRIILHNQASGGQVSLLQHVYVGPGKNSTNTIIATRESLLDGSQLASARRITATHLPFTTTNTPWTSLGSFSPGNVLLFTVPLSYKDQASNPFLHTFHPDHDNLDPYFKTVQPRGVESYDITRTVKMTFNPPGTDFASLTAAAQSRSGVYEETMTIGAQGAATRDFRLSGSFTLQLISPVATLTTQ